MSNPVNTVTCPHCNGSCLEESTPSCAYCGRAGVIEVQSPPYTGKPAKIHPAPPMPNTTMQQSLPGAGEALKFAKPQWDGDGNVISPQVAGPPVGDDAPTEVDTRQLLLPDTVEVGGLDSDGNAVPATPMTLAPGAEVIVMGETPPTTLSNGCGCVCGRSFKSNAALLTHKRYCKVVASQGVV